MCREREIRLMKRICKACGSPVLKRHRWRNVNRRFLWWTWKVVMHLNCKSPEEGAVTRLKGEVPLPFPGPMEHVDPRSVYPPVTVR